MRQRNFAIPHWIWISLIGVIVLTQNCSPLGPGTLFKNAILSQPGESAAPKPPPMRKDRTEVLDEDIFRAHTEQKETHQQIRGLENMKIADPGADLPKEKQSLDISVSSSGGDPQKLKPNDEDRPVVPSYNPKAVESELEEDTEPSGLDRQTASSDRPKKLKKKSKNKK